MSDVMELKFTNLTIPSHIQKEQFWISLLYGLLEGTSSALGIARDDIDGCLYYRDDPEPSIIIFDDVPGGAGYTREISKYLKEILYETWRRMENCTCSPETSCYGCLRNYRNQYCHDELSRGAVIEALKRMIDPNRLRSQIKHQTFNALFDDVAEECHSIIEYCHLNNMKMPEIGYSLYDDQGVVAIAELAWPQEKKAILLNSAMPYRLAFEKRGWRIYQPDEYLEEMRKKGSILIEKSQ